MIAILAYDLTSAMDGAAPFADRGLKAKAVFDRRGLDDVDTDVLSLDLDSRFAVAPVAEQRFRAAGKALAHARLLYKTMDSTLRGNLCPEARGVMAGSGRPRALVVPAFPAAGRATLGGRQFVHGVPIERTEFACDAAHDSELDALVSRTGLEADLVWVGSPGLAAALARAVPAAARSPTRWPMAWRVLIVIGSRHPANAAQIDDLKAAGAVMVAAPSTPSSLQTSAQAVLAAFDEADVVCLVAPMASVEAQGHTSAELARWLGEVAKRSASAFEALVVTGGDTARRIVDALGAQSMDLAGEVEAGVPFGWLHTPRGGFAFATKAGGFGEPNTLVRCVEALRAHSERAA